MTRAMQCLLTGLFALSLLAQAPLVVEPARKAPAEAVAQAPVGGVPRIALVIGNGAYREGPLKNPPNDARAMAEALSACGFQVSLLVDGSRPSRTRPPA